MRVRRSVYPPGEAHQAAVAALGPSETPRFVALAFLGVAPLALLTLDLDDGTQVQYERLGVDNDG